MGQDGLNKPMIDDTVASSSISQEQSSDEEGLVQVG